jgi:hypothetical protein
VSAAGGSAFPSPGVALGDPALGQRQEGDYQGMSLRDYFAGEAIAECIRVADQQTKEPGPKLSALFEKAATYAYYAADALLKAREA